MATPCSPFGSASDQLAPLAYVFQPCVLLNHIHLFQGSLRSFLNIINQISPYWKLSFKNKRFTPFMIFQFLLWIVCTCVRLSNFRAHPRLESLGYLRVTNACSFIAGDTPVQSLYTKVVGCNLKSCPGLTARHYITYIVASLRNTTFL